MAGLSGISRRTMPVPSGVISRAMPLSEFEGALKQMQAHARANPVVQAKYMTIKQEVLPSGVVLQNFYNIKGEFCGRKYISTVSLRSKVGWELPTTILKT